MSHKGKSDDAPTKDSPSVDLEHMEGDGKHSGVSHPPTCTVVDAKPDHGEAHDKARKDHFRRAGLTAKGGSVKPEKRGAKSK